MYKLITRSNLSSSLLPLTIQTLIPNLTPQNQHFFNSNLTLDEAYQIHAYLYKTHFKFTPLTPLNPLNSPSTPSARYNFIITSYIKNNVPEFALKIYAEMRKIDTFEVDEFVVTSVIKAIGKVFWVRLGEEIHGFALKIGLDFDVFVNNSLIQMYSECGFSGYARKVFDEMPVRDVVSWSTMIRSYCKHRLFDEGFGIIREMNCNLVKPSEIALISMVELFSDFGDFKWAKPLHGNVIKYMKNDDISVSLSTALLDMYAKCGDLGLARRLFERLVCKNVVSWTAMVSGYIRCNRLEEGVEIFGEMVREGVSPNDVTVLSLMIGCGLVRALELGKELHGYVLRNGFSMDLALGTAMVDMYGKCSEIASSKAIFDRMENRDVMTWTALISAYAHANCVNEVINLFTQMSESGIRPNQVTMVSLLSVCSESGALDLGKWIHMYITRIGVEVDVILNTALIDMYAKCGDIDKAYKLFNEAKERDICLWNAMMSGFGMHGFGKEALDLFVKMTKAGVICNDVTFIGLLNACSHAGLVEEGKQVFNEMLDTHHLVPKVVHYGCMVDLLGRAGLLLEAYQIIQNMPMKPNIVIWGALLAACKTHKNPSLAQLAFAKIHDLGPENLGYNVLMSNLFAVTNRWTDVAGIRTAMKCKRVKKEPGFSSIEVNGSVHEFIMGDKSHPQTERITKMLTRMIEKLKDNGHKPNVSSVLINGEEEEKESN